MAEGKLESDIFRKRCNLSLVRCASPPKPALDSVSDGLKIEPSPLARNITRTNKANGKEIVLSYVLNR